MLIEKGDYVSMKRTEWLEMKEENKALKEEVKKLTAQLQEKDKHLTSLWRTAQKYKIELNRLKRGEEDEI